MRRHSPHRQKWSECLRKAESVVRAWDEDEPDDAGALRVRTVEPRVRRSQPTRPLLRCTGARNVVGAVIIREPHREELAPDAPCNGFALYRTVIINNTAAAKYVRFIAISTRPLAVSRKLDIEIPLG